MSNSLTKIRIHIIISTRDRLPLINPEFESNIYNFLKGELANQGCYTELINGTADHIHIIILLNPEKSLKLVLEEIVLSGTQFINKNYFPSGSFAWANDFAAFGISESQLPKMIEYVSKQKEIHTKQTFLQEYNEFLRLHGLNRDHQ
jgi:putative transposase